ncbi:MAG TPA: restriction endonuclease [Denitromonas sp.]|uniref:restriction endonuclease n=1 Tax=Denitromonas sp. TaxID=2734609 RepID=UPI001DF5E5DC|nr:restriction endonuclease [Rhodocyclaceae bacterium]MCP5220575.1 restriction endonuclease [Zoogloeaceae bacterium]HPR05025.1 restriction endonuclease [Denitromonas sp.]HQU88208.1 restriction endonuclease [Denitromonas sp.]HQV14340.1 restriction endonuclease [Denitromonas sp.]
MNHAKVRRRETPGTPRKARTTWVLVLLLLVLAALALWQRDLSQSGATSIVPAAALLVSVVLGGVVLASHWRSSARKGGSLGDKRRAQAPRHSLMQASEAPPTMHSAPTEFDPSAIGDADLSDFDPDMVPVAARVWTLSLLESLEWQRFEALCVAYYSQKAMSHRSVCLPHAAGRDVFLYQDKARLEQATGLVHVRSRGVTYLDVTPVRELIGAMTHEAIERGFLMTNGCFTPQARTLGREHGIVLVDGRVLLAMIERLPPEARDRLHAIATEGKYTTPTCPQCGEKMVSATGSHGDYWGCRHFPDCSAVLPRLPALN